MFSDVNGKRLVPGCLWTPEQLDIFFGPGLGEVHEQVHGPVVVVLAAGLLGGQVLQDHARLLTVDVAVILGEQLEFIG